MGAPACRAGILEHQATREHRFAIALVFVHGRALGKLGNKDRRFAVFIVRPIFRSSGPVCVEID
jgi:hypothetical protein